MKDRYISYLDSRDSISVEENVNMSVQDSNQVKETLFSASILTFLYIVLKQNLMFFFFFDHAVNKYFKCKFGRQRLKKK